MLVQSVFNLCKNKFSRPSFFTAYHQTFEVLRADTNMLKEEVYRLRYQVYCKENGLISENINLNEMERDIYDRHSLHSLLIHRPSGRAVGTVRIVLPREDKPLYSFPLQNACQHPLLYKEENIVKMCEISRLCMVKAFRKRVGDGGILPTYAEADWEKKPSATGKKVVYFRRMIPYAPLGLIMSAIDMAQENGIENCFCIMEKSQLYAMEKIGLKFSSLGPSIEFFGTQQPVIFNIEDMLESMKEENESCWDVVSDYGRLHKSAPA